jgi:hypothetical protein
MMVAGVGKRLGWDEARLQTLRDESTVALGISRDVASGENALSCEGLKNASRLVQKSLSKGERAGAYEHVAESGKTLSALADQYRNAYTSAVR